MNEPAGAGPRRHPPRPGLPSEYSDERRGRTMDRGVKKISSWAAILFAPTLVGTIYGMNFDAMPELDWVFDYPFAILLMAAVCTSLYFIFKRRDWL
ncbi:CorA family divalent cation transporter [Streptomyces sp. Root66D1]|uniref:CorA family divalent cation transporter n=1 Tax=unclassified Streptomyces TaxID=2593676 RepID=UPI00321F7A9F